MIADFEIGGAEIAGAGGDPVTLSPAAALLTVTGSLPTLSVGGSVSLAPAAAQIVIRGGLATLTTNNGALSLAPAAASIAVRGGLATITFEVPAALPDARYTIKAGPRAYTIKAQARRQEVRK